jgi:outer membrane lipoprotein carrier protein
MCTRIVATTGLVAFLLVAPGGEMEATDVAAAPPTQSATDLARLLQQKYDGVRDFSADFSHVYRGGLLRKQLTERGRLLIKKPGKMRWEYTEPEEKLFVSDGAKLYSYIPQDKQVIVTSVPPDDAAPMPTLFLAGRGNLLRDFAVSFDEKATDLPPGARALKLVPKAPQPDYDWLVLLVDPSTLLLRGLVTTDAQGGTSRFSFSNLKENVGLADKAFTFRIPRGVDVVTQSTRR